MTVPVLNRECQCGTGAWIGHGAAGGCPARAVCAIVRGVLIRYWARHCRANEDVNVAFVTLREGEPPEAIVGRFRAAVTRNGILKEHKDRRFFRSKGEKARLAARRSARRRRRSGI